MSSALRVRKAPGWKAPGFHRGLYDPVSRGCKKGLAGPDTDWKSALPGLLPREQGVSRSVEARLNHVTRLGHQRPEVWLWGSARSLTPAPPRTQVTERIAPRPGPWVAEEPPGQAELAQLATSWCGAVH